MAVTPLTTLTPASFEFSWLTIWLIASMVIGIIWQFVKVKNLILNVFDALFNRRRK